MSLRALTYPRLRILMESFAALKQMTRPAQAADLILNRPVSQVAGLRNLKRTFITRRLKEAATPRE